MSFSGQFRNVAQIGLFDFRFLLDGQGGDDARETAEELCLGSNLLYEWKQEAQGAPGGHEGSAAAGERLAAAELRSLRRENAILKMENDILKKAAVILGTKAQPHSGK